MNTVSNLGLGTAKASTTRYYLSTDTVRSANDILLPGSRTVSSLEPGASVGGSATETLPTTVPLGSYRVLVCADDTKVIAELDETNDCLAGNAVQVTLPNLQATDISKPPLSVQRGHSFLATGTVQNLGSVSSAASTNRYYLSLDSFKGAGDILLLGSRSVGILQPSGTSTGTVTGLSLEKPRRTQFPRERGQVSLGHPSLDQGRLGRVEADREHGSLRHRRPSYRSRSL